MSMASICLVPPPPVILGRRQGRGCEPYFADEETAGRPLGWRGLDAGALVSQAYSEPQLCLPSPV